MEEIYAVLSLFCIIGVIILVIVGLSFTVGVRNIELLKENSIEALADNGFEVVGYQSYQHSIILGGKHWYTLRRKENPNITYQGSVCYWNGEYHIYSLEAIDAIKPNNQ